MKIWHQSLTSIEDIQEYRDAVIQHILKIARPDVDVVLHGMTNDTYPENYPGHYITYNYLQSLHKEQFIRNALIAEKAGYDAVFIGTIPDVGLIEARALVDIPVIGYGQSSMHMASMLGSKIGIVNFLAPLADQLRFNAQQYGLSQKLGPIVQADIGFYDIMEGYKNPQPIIDKFIAAAETAIAQGADVIIPGEGPMNIFLATHHIHHVGNVPIIDSFGTGIKTCESLVDLQKISGMTVTRVGYYNEKPPTEIVEKLRDYYNLKQAAADMDFGLSVRATASV
ncbi:Asp/Glu/hydantoin racemase [Solibacillus kalamii]|uniref:Hydantoin racemase n=1 Tax=Solibacillus kalamii TaxID=1748298 RepID=A0ABX3ZHR8_9BACL|nr:aspartate/glutamate racemase family protein [Solibacillus kalamii]MBM7665409.1 Asp/Glu/hydantoin racemase [Solibacillus kalamii]OUZ39240.1 hydantoin racemase [Solibacillus kalamii]